MIFIHASLTGLANGGSFVDSSVMYSVINYSRSLLKGDHLAMGGSGNVSYIGVCCTLFTKIYDAKNTWAEISKTVFFFTTQVKNNANELRKGRELR